MCPRRAELEPLGYWEVLRLWRQPPPGMVLRCQRVVGHSQATPSAFFNRCVGAMWLSSRQIAKMLSHLALVREPTVLDKHDVQYAPPGSEPAYIVRQGSKCAFFDLWPRLGREHRTLPISERAILLLTPSYSQAIVS